jgi:hypothetical protein
MGTMVSPDRYVLLYSGFKILFCFSVDLNSIFKMNLSLGRLGHAFYFACMSSSETLLSDFVMGFQIRMGWVQAGFWFSGEPVSSPLSHYETEEDFCLCRLPTLRLLHTAPSLPFIGPLSPTRQTGCLHLSNRLGGQGLTSDTFWVRCQVDYTRKRCCQ